MRMAAPETRRGRLLVRLMAPMLEKGLRAANARLVAQLDAELERRGRDVPEEPEPPQPRPTRTST